MTTGMGRTVIIGVGLLGASVGLALKKRALAEPITGVGRSFESLDRAVQAGAIDAATLDARQGMQKADMVVIATPASLVIPMLDIAATSVPAHAIVLDVASAKQRICEHARHLFRTPRRFVGCHPMAGMEKHGPANGSPDLFEGTVCLVERNAEIDPEARTVVCRLWEALGAHTVDVDAAVHDAVLARTSHAPHVIASALAILANRMGAKSAYVGNGFRDATRIAGSRPEIWRDICMENRQALSETLAQFRNCIEEFEEMLTDGDIARLENFFIEGNVARERVLGT